MNNGWKLNEDRSQPRIGKSSNAGAVPRQKALPLETEFPTVEHSSIVWSWVLERGVDERKPFWIRRLLGFLPSLSGSSSVKVYSQTPRRKGRLHLPSPCFLPATKQDSAEPRLVPRAGFHPSPS